MNKKIFFIIIVAIITLTFISCDTKHEDSVVTASDWWIGTWNNEGVNWIQSSCIVITSTSVRYRSWGNSYEDVYTIDSCNNNTLIFGGYYVLSKESDICVSLVYYQGNWHSDKGKYLREYEENSSYVIPQFFWGEWVDMYDGRSVTVGYEKVRAYNSNLNNYSDYRINGYTDTTLAVESLGTFTKQSDNVMINDSIPYYRKGGSNIPYSVKVVGFVDSRAGGTFDQVNKRVTARSTTYSSYKEETVTDTNGEAVLHAPVSGDTQSVTVKTENGLIATADISVGHNGNNVGTIALVEEGQYNLKVSGSLSGEYLFVGDKSSSSMKLSIKNISNVLCNAASCKVEPADSFVSISSSENLSGILISNLHPGYTKEISLNVRCFDISEPYIDTGIKVIITNINGDVWTDFVPLRFFKDTAVFTVAAVATEPSTSSYYAKKMSGYVIYPDGNGQYFTVTDGSSQTVTVPRFRDDERYIFAFCGAASYGSMSSSTEMFYTVTKGSDQMSVITGGENIFDYYTFGENNDVIENAYVIDEAFEAYLSEGDIDYYSIGYSNDDIIGTPSCLGAYVYSDGTYSNVLNVSKTVIGIVYKQDENHNPTHLVSLEEVSLPWCINTAEGYSIKLPTVDDGSLNWDIICDNVTDEDVAGNYPAFEYCNNKTDGGKSWYLPSYSDFSSIIDAMSKVYSSINVLNSIGVDAATFGEGGYSDNYWTSSDDRSDGGTGKYARISFLFGGVWNNYYGTSNKSESNVVRAIAKF